MFCIARANSRMIMGGVACVTAVVLSTTAGGATVQLGNSGWEAVWDSSLDPYVDVQALSVNFGAAGGEGAVFINKSAEFIQGPVNGVFPTIPIVFREIAGFTGPVVQNIVIESEEITNSTGVDWTDFHLDVLDHGEVYFDVARTAASGGGGPIGWSIAPFTTAAFGDFLGANQATRLDIAGGTVANGDVWFPGSGASDGQLWIHVNNVAAPGNSLFVLKETPTPAPGAIALLAVGALFGSRRRRGC
jgi:MYXO-CTERM domain-containing protein